MTSAFYTNAEELAFKLSGAEENVTQPIADDELIQQYDIEKTTEWILQGKYENVALQFPDCLLNVSGNLLRQLRQKLENVTFFILADTYYGSCCIDEVAAEHYNADALVHYGHSCLSPTSRLPVLHVFGRLPIDVQHCREEFVKMFPDKDSKVIVIYDVQYSHYTENMQDIFDGYTNVTISRLNGSSDTGPGDNEEKAMTHNLGRTFRLAPSSKIEDYTFFYIGRESLFLSNFMLTMNRCCFYSYNAVTKESRKEDIKVNKQLMKRYYLVEKAKDAEIVGILVGTLGVKDYMETLNSLKESIKKAGKKSYTFVVGKLNVPKLANFPEVDLFVLVACPENSLLDSAEYYKPIVTPFEMELACNLDREWTGDYTVDFREILPGGKHFQAMSESKGTTMDVSLITGSVRQWGISDVKPTDTSSAVVSRDANLQVAKSAVDHLSERSWKGLDPQLGQTAVTKAADGTSGIAIGYTSEPDMNNS